MSGTSRQFTIGLGLGWIALPVLVVADDGVRAMGDGDSIARILCAAIVGGAGGLVIGACRLGWPGMAGCALAALGGGLLPYLVIAPVFGVHAPGINALDQYSIVIVAAAAGLAFATILATRSALRLEIRPLLPITVGLGALVSWLVFWALWVLGLSPRTV